jgi:hypothetical protein
MNLKQFQLLIVRPTLEHLGEKYCGIHAERLLIGTALTESRFELLIQHRGHPNNDERWGPAMGFYQMEPATHNDIWTEYLAFRKELAEKLMDLASVEVLVDIAFPPTDLEMELIHNLRYATAMARLHYWRVPEALVGNPADEIQLRLYGLYWKTYYNTPDGKGYISDFIEKAAGIMNLT